MTDTLYLESPQGTFAPAPADKVMQTASLLAQEELDRRGKELDPKDLKAMLPALFAGRDHEFMGVAFLDFRLRMIEFKIMAEGSAAAVEIRPREIARAAILNNSATIVLIHNHPGSIAEPSDNDKIMTERLGKILALFDIRVLDHWIVAGNKVFSFAASGLV